MPPKHLYIIGAGGHAKVAIGTARACGWKVIGAFDDNSVKHGEEILGVKVVGPIASLLCERRMPTLIAIGDNKTRLRLAEELNLEWATLVHPAAVVASNVRLEKGTLVLAGAVVEVSSIVGAHVIVNHNATIEHECHVADGVHISCNACLAGAAVVGRGSLVGAGAVVLPLVEVGEFCTIGAGAVATKNVLSHQIMIGNPARPITNPA